MRDLLPFQKKKGVMLDLESLSTSPNACITSIGACKFTFKNSEILETFKVNIDPKSCKEHGLHISKDTVDWWSKQSPEARRGWQTNPVELPMAIEMFKEWWGPDETQMFWCNGLSFDAPVLTSAFNAVGKKKPWIYSYEMDLRTVYSMVGFSNKAARANDKEGVYHDALDDAIAQTKQLLELFGYEG